MIIRLSDGEVRAAAHAAEEAAELHRLLAEFTDDGTWRPAANRRTEELALACGRENQAARLWIIHDRQRGRS
jgi:hypothetical protein